MPHIAFTHHRIGIHESAIQPAKHKPSGELVALQDLSGLDPQAVDRVFGLAHLAVYRKHGDAQAFRQHRADAELLLRRVLTGGLRDPAVDAEVARLAFEGREVMPAENFANDVLRTVHDPTESRLLALEVLGQIRFRQHRFRDAILLYEQLAPNRFDSRHWFYLEPDKKLGF